MRAHFAKGSASRARPVRVTQRRVVVKARFVAHVAGQAKTLRAHVAYLGREGAARQNQPEVGDQREPSRSQERSSEQHIDATIGYLSRERQGGDERFYDQSRNSLDARDATQGWHADKRHFRLIISAEDGEALGDLRPMIREVMAGLEAKLGTKLEWLGIDHWDTDNPHTHVLVRGRRADGQDLFIPSRILSHGIREHAQEVVTRVLGPRLEADLLQERWRDITRMGVTSLDRELVAPGKASSPTPTGAFYADIITRPINPDGPYGLFQISVTGFSNVYQSFGGGVGQIAIHGTNRPELIGAPASHGCVRMSNADISTLVPLTGLGTPVVIVD